MQGCDERAFVPFYRFYDTVHTFWMALSAA